ncbi:hypothetical protein, partial [Xanthomonas translucens]|uniref:hypothetical protein n=1 Tax=Xanthomonas campestris pv. translucens TaxID=343 RepID=UPI001E458441
RFSGGGGGEENRDVTCESLVATKPSMCPNPLPFPSGASYAEDRLPGASINGKSTLMMALAFTRGEIHYNGNTAATDANAAWLLAAALEQQTTNFTNGLKPLAESNKEFRVHLQLVCDDQTAASNAYRIPGVVTVPESYCFEMMKAFDQETNDQLTFIQWFAGWSRRYVIDLGDYIPGALKDSAALDNSIGVKWKVTSEDAKCSSWWTQVQQLQCGL